MPKAIINKLKYDTEVAEKITSWSNGYSFSDFNHCVETLYLTKNGNWFVVGDGGPKSRYAKKVGNGYSGSRDNIRPMTEEDAYNWLEEKGKPEVIEKYFDHMVADA